MESHPPLVHARHDLVVVEETAFASCRATFLDLTPKPFVVVHRTRQEVESDLVDGAPGRRGKACEFRFEFRRNLQVHEASVGGIQGSVNRCHSGSKSHDFLPWPGLGERDRLTPRGGRDKARWLA